MHIPYIGKGYRAKASGDYADRQTDRQTQTDRQSDRQTHTHRQTDTHRQTNTNT